jgi:hypothetical protein
MKNKLLGKKVLSCSFYLYRFRKYVSYGFPIINLCNPGIHYETLCIFEECGMTDFILLGQMSVVGLLNSLSVA